MLDVVFPRLCLPRTFPIYSWAEVFLSLPTHLDWTCWAGRTEPEWWASSPFHGLFLRGAHLSPSPGLRRRWLCWAPARGTPHPCCPPAARGLLSLPVPPCLPLRISFPHTLRGPSPWNRSLPEMKIGKPVLNFCHYSSRVIWDRNSCTAQALQLCRVMLFSSPDKYRRGCVVCVWEGVEAPFFILFYFLNK